MKPGGILMIEVPRKKKRHNRKYKKIEPKTYVPLKGPEAGVPHYIFDKKELKKFFAYFEILDIYITRDKIQTLSPHYTMFAKFKGTS
jgi:hypothetical protein